VAKSSGERVKEYRERKARNGGLTTSQMVVRLLIRVDALEARLKALEGSRGVSIPSGAVLNDLRAQIVAVPPTKPLVANPQPVHTNMPVQPFGEWESA